PGIVKTKLDGFDQTDYLTGKSDKSARDTFFYFAGSTPAAVRWKNWKFYYTMEQGGAEGWMKPTLKYTWSAIQNIKRDPFEQPAGGNQKNEAVSFPGGPGGSNTAVPYHFPIAPPAQQLGPKDWVSYQHFPPLQAPETYNLDQVLAAIKSMKH